MRRTVILLAAAIALGVAGCGDDEEQPAAQGSGAEAQQGSGEGSVIIMKGLQFEPKERAVRVGEKVTWRNDEAIQHNVVGRGSGGPRSDLFGEGETYAFTPKAAGTIDYVCTIHPGMEGTLTVREQGGGY